MKFPRKILLALVLVLLFGFLGMKLWRAWSTAAAKGSVKECVRDIEYVPFSKNPFQTMDFYVPSKARFSPMPVIVWIHGGAWVSGDKNHPPVEVMTARGYAVASLNYRLSQDAQHPAQIFDCKAALRFLRAHAKEINIDPNKIGVWGHSAGGHLAALLATSGDVKELEGELGNNSFSSRVDCAADWAGPTDLVTIASQAPPNCKIDFRSPSNPVAVLMGSNQPSPAYLEASPVQWVSSDDPPILVLHAQDDDVVPVGQAKEFCEALKKKSVATDCQIKAYGGHGLFKPEFVNETMDFFDRTLGQK